MTTSPDGSVSFASVSQVLLTLAQAGSFTVRIEGMRVTLVRDGSPEVIDLQDPVGRRMVARLANKYCAGRVEYFYHPNMIINGGNTPH